MLQRLVAGGALVYFGCACLSADPMCAASLTRAIGAFAGALLIAGLWTPVVGVVVALVEARIAFLPHGQPVIPLILELLGLTLAMIGPGSWSVDSWMFGRKHIVPPDL